MPNIVSEPLPVFITFYYYYSYLTLFISWTLAPLLFYAILTQSKTLGKFKWLIFNYSFWSLCLTTFFGLLKPVFLPPAYALILSGVLHDYGSYTCTMALFTLLVTLCTTCMGCLCATLTYRYLMVFPSVLKEWFTIKKAIFFSFLLPILGFILLSAVIIQMAYIPKEEVYQWAMEYDATLQKYFTDKTFFIAPYFVINIICKITSFMLIFSHFGAFLIAIFIGFQMYKYKNVLKSNTKYDILISIFVQSGVSFAFLVTPYTFLITCFAFEIPYTASFVVLLECLYASHCFVDFCTTLYFVTPYRKFVLGISKRNYVKISVIPAASTVVVQNEDKLNKNLSSNNIKIQ